MFSHTFELFPNDKVIIQPYKNLEGTNLKSLQDKFKEEGGCLVYLNSELVKKKNFSHSALLFFRFFP